MRKRLALIAAAATVAFAAGGAIVLSTSNGPHLSTQPARGGLCQEACGTVFEWSGVTLPGQTGYYVFKNNLEVGNTTNTRFTFPPLACNTLFTFAVQAHDDAGNTSQLYTTPYTSPACIPVNTAPPTISGTTQQGATLTATPGAWTNNPTHYDYEWLDCDTSGQNCTDVAAQVNSPTYTLDANDVGSAMVVIVTASNNGGSASQQSNPTAVVASAGPVNQSLPQIGGTTQAGSTLTVTNNGVWTGSPTSFDYSWADCDNNGQNCVAVDAPVTTSSYTLDANDVGSTIEATVTAKNATGSGTATSAPTAVITAATGAPVNTALPVVSDTSPTQGEALTTTNGTWSGTGITFTYAWKDCSPNPVPCTVIPGATSASYTVQASDVGSSLKSSVTATNGGGSTSAGSAQTAAVTASSGGGNATSCPPATATGTGTVTHANPGDDLTAKTSSLGPGDVLVLNDGTYNPTVDSGAQGAWYIHNVHGTATNPIIIEGATDGGATVTGANEGGQPAVYTTASSYITFCGFNVKNSGGHQLFLMQGAQGGNPGDGTITNLTVERMTATNAASGDVDCFKVGQNDLSINAHILFQDDAAMGPCRYGFASHAVNGSTVRRSWAYHMRVTNFSPAPRSCFNAYGSQNVTLENDICNNIPDVTDNNFYASTWQTSASPSTQPQLNAHYFGDIFFNACEGVNSTTNASSGTTMKDMYISIPSNSTCAQRLGDPTTNFYRPEGIHWNDPTAVSVDNTVINNSHIGINSLGGAITLTNGVLINNDTAISGNGTTNHSFTDFFGNTTNGDTLSGTDMNTNPGYNTATYGTPGAYLMPAPNLIGKGQNGADVGAHIVCEYVNGQLTNIPLWPWPMESRILATFGQDVDASIWNGTLPGC